MVGSVIAQPPSLAGLLTVGGVQYPDVAGPLAGGARALAGTHLAAPACWAEASQASGDRTAAAGLGLRSHQVWRMPMPWPVLTTPRFPGRGA